MLKKTLFLLIIIFLHCNQALSWPIPDSGQTKCYDNSKEIPCPQPGEDFYGQDGNGRMYRLGEVNVATKKNRNPTNVRNQCRGKPCVRPLTETEIKPMSDGEVKP
jgi:hypothetical protein